MRVASITWDPHLDTTKITFSDEFLESNWCVNADVLKDANAILEDAYQNVVENKSNKKNCFLEKTIKI
jgi:hypothetical protein